jgi:hypothetical protein
MKTLLQYNQTRLFNQGDGKRVDDSTHAQALLDAVLPERSQQTERIPAPSTAGRIDPNLFARFSSRAPGIYQAGE